MNFILQTLISEGLLLKIEKIIFMNIKDQTLEITNISKKLDVDYILHGGTGLTDRIFLHL